MNEMDDLPLEKLEFESMAASCLEDSKVKKEEPSKVAGKTPGGSVYKVKRGNGRCRWRAEFRSRNVRVYAGYYATAEEARAALDRKRSEFDSVADPQTNGIRQSEVQEEKVSDVKARAALDRKRSEFDSVADPQTNEISQSEVHVEEGMSDVKSKPIGVFRRKSGRWYAEIRHPITKVRGSVGTYETAEEAAEALKRKKEEFALMVKDGEVQLSGAKRKTPDVSDSEDGESMDRKRVKPHDVYQRKLETWYADMRGVVAKTKSSVGASMAHAEEIGTNDRNVRVTNEDLYVGVIDAYGRLIGEFSRIDDELWLCRSLNDDDDPYGIQ